MGGRVVEWNTVEEGGDHNFLLPVHNREKPLGVGLWLAPKGGHEGATDHNFPLP